MEIETRLTIIENDVKRLMKKVEGNGDSIEHRLRKEIEAVKMGYESVTKAVTSLEHSVNALSSDLNEHIQSQSRREESDRAFAKQVSLTLAMQILTLLTMILSLIFGFLR